MVTITRVNLQRCKFTSKKEKEIKKCREILSIFMDGCYFSELFKSGKWDGYYKFFDSNDYFDFGLVDELVFHLKAKKIKYKIIERFQPIQKEFSVDKRMWYYQKKAVKTLYKKGIGIIKVPPRGGKTYIAAEMMRISAGLYPDNKDRFLMVVDTQDLLKQAVIDISEYLGVAATEIGTITSTKQDFKKYNVGMAQTMVSIFYAKLSPLKDLEKTRERDKRNREKVRNLNKFLSTLNFLMIDEVHDNSSEKRLNVYRKCKAVKNIAAFSGTPFKQFTEIENLTIKGFFGGICYDIEKKELQKSGYLTMDKVFLVHIDHGRFRNKRADGYQEFLTQYIHKNDYRNSVLTNVIQACLICRWKTLVLFNSVEHGKVIRDIMNLPFISGESDGVERDLQKTKFLKGRGKILLASNIFKKGITLPEAQVVIIADGGLEGANIIQKYSRVLGISEGKTNSAIIDLMDSGVDYFADHSLNRLEVYNNDMEGRVEVYNDFEIPEMADSINEWFGVNNE